MPSSEQAHASNREIRVFLSSTFKDMQAERNYLLTNVFPSLRALCAQRQVTFTEIDLRWGVTEEESNNGRTIEICLKEIDRCRNRPPFFIGFLGERYGWVPSLENEKLAAYWEAHKDSPYAKRIKKALDTGISVTELEIQYAFLDNPSAKQHARFFLRGATLTKDLYDKAGNPPKIEFYDDSDGKLKKLKDQLRVRDDNNTILGIDGYTSIEHFGRAIEQFLREEIDALFPEDKKLNADQRRDFAHQIYANSRRRTYVPVTKLKDDLVEALSQAEQGEVISKILIEGEAGLGKSAFVADMETWLPTQQILKNRPWVHAHYVSADGSRSLNDWLDRLLTTLAHEHVQSNKTKTTNECKFRWLLEADAKIQDKNGNRIDDRRDSEEDRQTEAVLIALSEVQQEKNSLLVLIIDAADQFKKGVYDQKTNKSVTAEYLSSVPLPPKVCLVVTARPSTIGTEWDKNWQRLVLNPLDQEQIKDLITAFLKENYAKDPGSNITDRLAEDTACRSPLFLRLALEELRIHALHETMEQKTTEILACGDTDTLLTNILESMDSTDYRDDIHIGLATWVALLIAAIDDGLSRNDLSYLAASVRDPLDPTSSRPKLPDLKLSAIIERMDPFLIQEQGRIRFNHESFVNTLTRRNSIENTFWPISLNIITDNEPRSFLDIKIAASLIKEYAKKYEDIENNYTTSLKGKEKSTLLALLCKKIELDYSSIDNLHATDSVDLLDILTVYFVSGGSEIKYNITKEIKISTNVQKLRAIYSIFSSVLTHAERWPDGGIIYDKIRNISFHIQHEIIENTIRAIRSAITNSYKHSNIFIEEYGFEDYESTIGSCTEETYLPDYANILYFALYESCTTPKCVNSEYTLAENIEKILQTGIECLTLFDALKEGDYPKVFFETIKKVYSCILTKLENYIDTSFENTSVYLDKNGNAVNDMVDENGTPYDCYCANGPWVQDAIERGEIHPTELFIEDYTWSGDDNIVIKTIKGFDLCREFLSTEDAGRFDSIVKSLTEKMVKLPNSKENMEKRKRLHPGQIISIPTIKDSSTKSDAINQDYLVDFLSNRLAGK